MSIENPWKKPQELRTEYNEIEIGSTGEMIVKRQVGAGSAEEPATINRSEVEINDTDFSKAQNLFNSLGATEKQAIFQEIENNLRGISPNEYQEEYRKELQRIINKRTLEGKN
jgi:catalase